LRIGEAVKAEIDTRHNLIIVTNEDTATKKHKREIPYLPELLPDGGAFLRNITAAGAQTYFKRLYKKLGICAVVHSFRVTFISICAHLNYPIKWIQEMAGHTQAKTTMDVYAKLLKNDGTSPVFEYLKQLKGYLGF
jgi:integrase